MFRYLVPLVFVTGCSGSSDGWQTGSAQGGFPCEPEFLEVYRVQVTSPGRISARVDTISDDTSFDPLVGVLTVNEWAPAAVNVDYAILVDVADDDFPCTFPPPAFSCPALNTAVAGDDVALLVGNASSCAGTQAVYTMTVDIDGEPARLRNLGLVTPEDLSYAYSGYTTTSSSTLLR